MNKQVSRVDVLIHDDTGGDLDLIKKSDVLSRCKIIQISDAQALKREISNYQFVVGSRYHGLVAALSQNIPVISLGWSHKYAELMKSYNIEEFHYTRSGPDVGVMLNRMLSKNEYSKLQAILNSVNQRNKLQLDQLWRDVFLILK